MPKSKLRDFDPEALLDPAPSSSSDEEQSDFSDAGDDNAGREHYLDVGKSKLRKKEVVPLGPQYTGSRISRNAAEDDDSDDPFARGFDDAESDDDEDEDDGSINGVAINGEDVGSGDDHSQSEEDEEDEDEDMDSAVGSGSEEDDQFEHDSDEEDSDEEASEDDSGEEGEGATLRKMMGETKLDGDAAVREMLKDTKSLATNIAAAAQSDVAKGNAIKEQRKTFDSLLNTRIRLQKALISTNSMVAEVHKSEEAPNASIEAAETAALALLNNLTDLRASLDEARTGQKRKRTAFTSETSSTAMWDTIKLSESGSMKHRKTIMEKWSAKTRGVSAMPSKGQLNAGAQQTLTEVLDSQLANSTHLVARTHMPRSCAPLQSASSKPVADPNIYDDADFYGLLLKELLEQRSADLASNGTAEFVVQAPWQVARDAKTKKVVDTKASKGRRLRYTVHEKLQNFMAPEERGTWGERQREELFSSLFGQRAGLGEHDEVESDQEDDAMDAEEQGLMLFRN
ncbi:TRAUB-domain-containing protein [Periconia macrospinosa]|uniref:Protein BFR2 n=1 Tax=Periconia macrospinosa TaxID=97972 RepID=A0A2V1DSG1_9PLEO|nr:TRAUB-domain-containing protein [Periconia macrospinosa]